MNRKQGFGLMTTWLLVAGVSWATSGCYRSVVQPPGAVSVEPSFEDRQWFTMAGTVRLSGSAGAECGSSGVAYTETRMGGGDILVNIALLMTGTLVGSLVCPESENIEAQSVCISSFASLTPLLLSSRTVSYKCQAVGAPARRYGSAPGPGSGLPEDVRHGASHGASVMSESRRETAAGSASK